jgi:hypothetical protein
MARVRSLLVVALLALGAVLAPLGLVATWTSNLVGDSDRYVETVAPLAENPAVQDAIAGRITAEVLAYVDAQALADDAVDALAGRDLPPSAASALRALGPPLADGVAEFVRQRVDAVVRSEVFVQAWAEANRSAHGQLVAALTGEGSVRVGDEGVSVDLAAFVAAVRADLIDRGFAAAERIPDVPATFTVVWPADLVRAQSAFGALDRTATWLPFVALAALSAGVLAARHRRRAVAAAGLAVAGSMLLLGLALTALRPVYLDAVPPDLLAPAAAAAVFDTLLRFLRDGIRVVLLVALVVAGVALLRGPSPAAVAVRRAWRELTAGQGVARLRAGRAGAWVRSHTSLLRWAVVVVTALGFLALDRPTPSAVLALLGLAVVALSAVELLGGGASPVAVPQQRGGDGADRGEAPADGRSASALR